MRPGCFKFEARRLPPVTAPRSSARRDNALAPSAIVVEPPGEFGVALRPRGTSGASTRRIPLRPFAAASGRGRGPGFAEENRCALAPTDWEETA